MNQPIKKHGGARAGAGRPPNERVLLPAMPATGDPLEFLRHVMGNPANDARLRLAAAVAMMPYVHTKRSDTGKKDEAEKAAKRASIGRFASARPPMQLVKQSTKR